MISYLEFKKIFDRINGEPEIEIKFSNRSSRYMIIKYDVYVTFQRFGNIEDQSGEIRFETLDDLYNKISIDDICLRRDWNNIEDIIINECISLKDDKDLFYSYASN